MLQIILPLNESLFIFQPFHALYSSKIHNNSQKESPALANLATEKTCHSPYQQASES